MTSTDFASSGRRTIRAPTLASAVARRIEADVVSRGWPIGRVLGSETDLLDRFGVSRAVLREAVRIVEHTGAARMRRGPGGGLVVSEPNRAAVSTAMSVWFSYVGVTIDEMLEVRQPLLVGAVRLAVERGPDKDVTELLDQIDELAGRDVVGPRQLAKVDGAIAALAGNPPLRLFIETVADLGISAFENGRAVVDPPLRDVEARAQVGSYRELVESIARHDAADAVRRMDRLGSEARARMHDVRRRRPVRRAEAPSHDKLAERVAGSLRDDIENAGWPIGEVIGSETDLIERYGVSRAILREAVRILEHHGAVRTKRGPHGGLVVTAPDVAAIVGSARVILEYEAVTAAQLFEARSVLEVAATRLAAERCSAEVGDELRTAIAMEARDGHAAEKFMPVHHRLADATGNALFPLFVDVMGELIPSRVKADRRSPERMHALSVDVHRAHSRIVEAVVAGDVDLAERRMQRHLLASCDVLE